MKEAGYTTGFFGKWHVGGSWFTKGTEEIFAGNNYGDSTVDYGRIAKGHPNQFGFDYSCQLPAGIQNNPFAYYENGEWMPLEDDSIIIPRKETRKNSHCSGYTFSFTI